MTDTEKKIAEIRKALEKATRPRHPQRMRGDGGMNWISVRERQPEKGKRVLVCIQTRFGPEIDIRRHLESGRFVHFNQDGMITHWMPLPEPPKGE